MKRRFRDVAEVEVIPAGLSDRAEFCELTVSGSSSSRFARSEKGAATVRVEMISLDAFLSDRGIQRIDLLKLNIEGGEFAVLDALIRSGWIKSVDNLQVQFHSFVEGAESKRAHLQKCLSETHVKTWDYPFVWENWSLSGLT